MKAYYNVYQIPFGDESFGKRLIATCKYERDARNLIRMCNNWHSYEIVKVEK